MLSRTINYNGLGAVLLTIVFAVVGILHAGFEAGDPLHIAGSILLAFVVGFLLLAIAIWRTARWNLFINFLRGFGWRLGTRSAE